MVRVLLKCCTPKCVWLLAKRWLCRNQHQTFESIILGGFKILPRIHFYITVCWPKPIDKPSFYQIWGFQHHLKAPSVSKIVKSGVKHSTKTWVSESNPVGEFDIVTGSGVVLQVLVCSLYQVGVSLCPARVLRRVFPPVVTGTCLILLGSALISPGFSNWGGGVYCGSQVPFCPERSFFTSCMTSGESLVHLYQCRFGD